MENNPSAYSSTERPACTSIFKDTDRADYGIPDCGRVNSRSSWTGLAPGDDDQAVAVSVSVCPMVRPG